MWEGRAVVVHCCQNCHVSGSVMRLFPESVVPESVVPERAV